MVHNSDGVTVDPVPFLVVSCLGFAVSFAVGPLYVMELGASLPVGLGVASATTAAVAVVAYHRYVWTDTDCCSLVPVPGAVTGTQLQQSV
jgi:hypothetical protein